MQTARQWMVTHEWMVNGNRQTEWIEKRGLLLWLAFYTGGLGGGLYLVSLLFDNLWGMLAGWIIVAIFKGAFHILYLGKPARFWRLVLHPQTSWLSRGLMFVGGFAGFGFIQIVLQYFIPEQTAAILVFKVLAGIFALCVATYTGFVLNSVKGVPFWNPSILPLLFVTCGILGGFGIIVAIGQFSSGVNVEAAETFSRIFLFINAWLIAIYLLMAALRESTGKRSVLYQIQGSMSLAFWIGVVLAGIVIPALIALYSFFAQEAAAIILFGTACEIAGGAMLRYCILKSAMYNPIFTHESLKERVI